MDSTIPLALEMKRLEALLDSDGGRNRLLMQEDARHVDRYDALSVDDSGRFAILPSAVDRWAALSSLATRGRQPGRSCDGMCRVGGFALCVTVDGLVRFPFKGAEPMRQAPMKITTILIALAAPLLLSIDLDAQNRAGRQGRPGVERVEGRRGGGEEMTREQLQQQIRTLRARLREMNGRRGVERSRRGRFDGPAQGVRSRAAQRGQAPRGSASPDVRRRLGRASGTTGTRFQRGSFGPVRGARPGGGRRSPSVSRGNPPLRRGRLDR